MSSWRYQIRPLGWRYTHSPSLQTGPSLKRGRWAYNCPKQSYICYILTSYIKHPHKHTDVISSLVINRYKTKRGLRGPISNYSFRSTFYHAFPFQQKAWHFKQDSPNMTTVFMKFLKFKKIFILGHEYLLLFVQKLCFRKFRIFTKLVSAKPILPVLRALS